MNDRLFPPNTNPQPDPNDAANDLSNPPKEQADRLRFAAIHALDNQHRTTPMREVTIPALIDKAGGLKYTVARQLGVKVEGEPTDKYSIKFNILGLGRDPGLSSQYGLKPGIAAVNVEIDNDGWRIASLTKYGENEPIPVVDQSEALLSDRPVGQSFFEQLTYVLSQDPANLSANQQTAA